MAELLPLVGCGGGGKNSSTWHCPTVQSGKTQLNRSLKHRIFYMHGFHYTTYMTYIVKPIINLNLLSIQFLVRDDLLITEREVLKHASAVETDRHLDRTTDLLLVKQT